MLVTCYKKRNEATKPVGILLLHSLRVVIVEHFADLLSQRFILGHSVDESDSLLTPVINEISNFFYELYAAVSYAHATAFNCKYVSVAETNAAMNQAVSTVCKCPEFPSVQAVLAKIALLIAESSFESCSVSGCLSDRVKKDRIFGG